MKKKNILVRIFCALLICCFGLMSISCGLSLDELLEIAGELVGWDEDDPSSGDNPGIDEALPADLYGSKVLYRPDDYDYDYGSGGADGTGEGENDYYGQYAYGILNYLYNIYAIGNNSYLQYLSENYETTGSNFDMENLPYLYDSIRYKVDTVGQVTHSAELDGNGNLTNIQPLDESYEIVGANLNTNWNWTFSYLAESVEAGLTDTEYTVQPNYYIANNYIYNTYETNYYTFSYIINEIYSLGDYQQNYNNIYLGAVEAADYDNYSDFVKTLEYVIYSYAVDLEPAEVVVTESSAYPYYTIRIGNFESVDSALETAKTTFEILGTYVGLVSRQITKIQNWILENIIGQDALNDDSFTSYYQNDADDEVFIEVTHQDGSISYQLSTNASNRYGQSTYDLGRNYQTAVENIVAAVCNDVSIGKNDDDSDVTIDDRFLASNIMEYAGSTFTIQDDSNFPVYDSENPEHAYAIRPLEYQSVVLMFKQETYIDGLWLALKYDADGDGTEEDVYNWDEYIDIIVDLNYYNHATNTRRIIQSKKVRVYDGPYAIDYMYGFEGDTGGGGDGELVPRDHCSGVVFDDLGSLHVGVFNVDIGGGILKTDVGRNDYKGDPLVSLDPLVLVGTNNIRRYYEIVEPGSTDLDQEALEDGYTYTSGRLNPTMFSGSDGCDYIEITYKVIKEAGNMTKNYKFYTGLAYLDNDDEPSLY